MTTTNNNRPILHQKRWEPLNPNPFGNAAGCSFAILDSIEQIGFYHYQNSNFYIYYASEDAYMFLPSSSTSVVASSGTTSCTHPWSTGSTIGAASLSATAGTTSTITTNQTLVSDLRGWKIHILEGPNAGVTLTISSNTIGTNSVITVPTQASAFSNATKYRLLTPRWYVFFASSSNRDFRVYDFATNTWTGLSVTNLPTTWSTDGAIVNTSSWIGSDYDSFATGTATSATATTLVNSAKSWSTNQWINYQIRITGGTGAGQIRTITANDSTSVTVATWTTTPDNTSTYSIEGNDDFLYLIGNGSSTMYRYQISNNTWTVLSPAVARTGSPSSGMTFNWVFNSKQSDWTNENTIINGRRLYSFRGSAGSSLDYYDIPSNSWVSATYNSTGFVPFDSGTRYALVDDKIYLCNNAGSQLSRTWYYFDCAKNRLVPWAKFPNYGPTPGSANVFNSAFRTVYRDGNTEINYINYMPPSTYAAGQMFRMMVI